MKIQMKKKNLKIKDIMENNRGLRVTIPSNILRSTKNQIASLLYRL